MKKIIVVGANGQLGSCLQELANNEKQIEFVFLTNTDLDITDQTAVQTLCGQVKPDVIINAAAYTAVDKAETDEQVAYDVNAKAVGYLAEACSATGARLIHVSTDYVFDGNATTPYREDDMPNPQGVYGATKLEGEKLALQGNANAVVVRTSWVYSKYGHNFVKTMMRLMKERDTLNVVDDQVGCPTHAIDLAKALLIMATTESFVPGIYHFSNSGPISWYTFAEAIREIGGFTTKVSPISSDQYPTPAKRPAWSVMSNDKIAALYGIVQQDWRKSLESCMAQLMD